VILLNDGFSVDNMRFDVGFLALGKPRCGKVLEQRKAGPLRRVKLELNWSASMPASACRAPTAELTEWHKAGARSGAGKQRWKSCAWSWRRQKRLRKLRRALDAHASKPKNAKSSLRASTFPRGVPFLVIVADLQVITVRLPVRCDGA
jgi:hypothetical protein